MKKAYLSVLIILNTLVVSAQPDTEIYVFKLNKINNDFSISHPVNISNQNPGYDNQPHFLNDESVMYASGHNDQTDIILMDLKDNSRTYITQTEGSEYSPTPVPEEKAFTAINLEKDGTQLLWKYPFDGSSPEVLIKDLKVGYHCWFNNNTIVAFVLGDVMTLQVCDLKTGTNKIVDENIGRSLHKIPGQELVSYIDKNNEIWMINSLNPLNGQIKQIMTTLPEVEDMTWHPAGIIFMGHENILYKYHKGVDVDWIQVGDLSDYELGNITRLAINKNGDKIAIVVDQ